MDLLTNVPSWSDIERNLDQKFSAVNQSINQGVQGAHDSWDGFTRRVSDGASQAYGYMGGHRIDNVQQALAMSYPILQENLKRKWSSIGIEQILPVLLQLVKEVCLILGGSVAVGTAAGGALGALAVGVGAAPGAAAGAGIGLQVGNLILMALGLSAIAEYFYRGLPACLSTLYEGMVGAWTAEEGVRPVGLDPSGGSAALIQERIERSARQLAHGQEQLVLLLLTAIVTYLLRGQVKSAVVGSMESIAARSARLQAEIVNKQFANWLAKNEAKLLARPELQIKEPAPLQRPQAPEVLRQPDSPAATKPVAAPPTVMSLSDAVGRDLAEYWTAAGRRAANESHGDLSALLTDDQMGALHGYTLEGYKLINPALRGETMMTPQLEAFATHINEGLARLPSFPGGETWRGTRLKPDQLAAMQMGLPTIDRGFMSTSAEQAKAFGGNVKMLVRGTSGKDIAFLSGHPEAEVLYPSGTQFQILNRIESGSVTHFLLEEMP